MKFGIYFSKKISPSKLPDVFTKKPLTYFEFIEFGKKLGHEIYLLSEIKNYSGRGKFKKAYKYKGGLFEEVFDVTMDCIYDKSTKLEFPGKNEKLVINDIKFKKFCADKSAMQKLLSDFMPAGIVCRNYLQTKNVLNSYEKEKIVACKPLNGMGGKGVLIGMADELKNKIKNNSYVVQEFVDTSGGIRGITGGVHDLRLVLCGREILFSHVRTPVAGELVSNAGGGEMKEVSVSKIPKFIKDFVLNAGDVVCKKYGDVIFSVDIGISNKKCYIFEINDIFGFPKDDFLEKKAFFSKVYALAERKILFANK